MWHNKERKALDLKRRALRSPNRKLSVWISDDFELIVEKNRHAEYEGTLGFYTGNGRTLRGRYDDDVIAALENYQHQWRVVQ